MVSLLSGHAVAGACAPTSWLSRSCPRESSAPGWCNCTSVVQEDEAFWPVVLPEGNMKPLVIWLPVQVVSGTECAVMRLSDGSLHAGSAGHSLQHHEDHQREARENGLLIRREGCHRDRKSTRLNSSHRTISYAVFCLKK